MIRVIVAEDVGILRRALVELLGFEDDIEVVADIADGDAIVATALEHTPDVAVIDIELPGLDGLTAAAKLHERLPSCKTLILTGHGRPGNLRRSANAKTAGFMLKDAAPQDLAAAIRTVAGGGRVIDPKLAYAALDTNWSPLTDRELEVLALAASGSSAREIAEQLPLSYGTVTNYLSSAATKLGARTRIDAIRIATEAGWI